MRDYLSMLGLKLNHVSKRGHRCPLYQQGLTLISAQMINHVPSKVWDEITHPFQNGYTIKVWEKNK